MKILLVVDDGEQLRSFHKGVFDKETQFTLGLIAKQAIARANGRMPAQAQVTPTVSKSYEELGNVPKSQAPMMIQGELARSAGFSGNVCESCGSFNMKQTGTCETCQDCGWNKGCG